MKNLLCFVAGAAIGSVVTWKLIEKKYKDLADEEIESVVETFKNKNINNVTDVNNDISDDNIIKSDSVTDVDDDIEKTEVEEYNEIIDNENYSDEKSELTTPIFIIDENEFGVMDGYDTKTWTCWADNVVTDEYEMEVANPSKYIGDAACDLARSDETGVCFVRNIDEKCDYEVMTSEKNYNE